MVSSFAQLRIRFELISPSKLAALEYPQDRLLSLVSQPLDLESCGSVPLEPRLKWVKGVADIFLTSSKSKRSGHVRDIDLLLKSDGEVEVLAVESPQPDEAMLRRYPARYQIPNNKLEELNSAEEKANRTELFALGCILYELISGNRLFPDLNDDEVLARYAEGDFPDDVWKLSKVFRILGCWCPAFAKELLEARGSDTLRTKFVNYVRKHPVLFGFQVLGGVASVASLAVLPVLGAIGFGAIGPAGGSIAAGWQAGVGLVEAGSFFAWCQSVAMGGAALGGILATGLGGAGVAVVATVAGALDYGPNEEVVPDLKERFLAVWKRKVADGVGAATEKPKGGSIDVVDKAQSSLKL